MVKGKTRISVYKLSYRWHTNQYKFIIAHG